MLRFKASTSLKHIQTKRRTKNPNEEEFRESAINYHEASFPVAEGLYQELGARAESPETAVGEQNAFPNSDWERVPLSLRRKGTDVRVESVVSGTLSRWTCEVPKEQAAELFCVQWDEGEGKFKRSDELAKHNYVSSLETATGKRNFAAGFFANVAEKRTALGMVGGVVDCVDCAELPETTADKIRINGTGNASSGPIRSTITERLRPFKPKEGQYQTHSAEVIARIFEQVGCRGMIQAPERNKLQFEFIGADEAEENVFYFAQKKSVNPNRTGPVKWRLQCLRDTVWKSAAPRAYGPSREWGGSWGGGVAAFTNSDLFNYPGSDEVIGGIWEPCERFVLSVVDEVRHEVPFDPFEPGPTLSATAVLSGPYNPHFTSGRTVMPHTKTVSRTIAPRGLPGTYRVQQQVQVGLPPCGYPGWSNRLQHFQNLMQERLNEAGPGARRGVGFPQHGMQSDVMKIPSTRRHSTRVPTPDDADPADPHQHAPGEADADSEQAPQQPRRGAEAAESGVRVFGKGEGREGGSRQGRRGGSEARSSARATPASDARPGEAPSFNLKLAAIGGRSRSSTPAAEARAGKVSNHQTLLHNWKMPPAAPAANRDLPMSRDMVIPEL